MDKPEEEKPGRLQSVGKETVNIIDQDVYEFINKPRRRGFSRWTPEDQETVSPRSCQRRDFAEKVARESCLTFGVAKRKFGAA